MSGLRAPVYTTRTIIGVVFSLMAVRLAGALLTQAPASKTQTDANPPGKISNTAPVPTVTAIPRTSRATSGGTFVTLTRTGLPAGVTTGGTSATNVIASLSTRSFEEKYRGL